MILTIDYRAGFLKAYIGISHLFQPNLLSLEFVGFVVELFVLFLCRENVILCQQGRACQADKIDGGSQEYFGDGRNYLGWGAYSVRLGRMHRLRASSQKENVGGLNSF